MLRGGAGGEDMNFSPFLASISLVFPTCHAQSVGRQAAQATGGRRLFLPAAPPLFLLLHASCSPLPLRGPGVGPQPWPQWWSPSRCLLPLARGGCSSPSTCRPGGRGCSGTGSGQLTDTPAVGQPPAPSAQTPQLTPQTLTASKTPEARAVVISEITLWTLFLNQQNEEKKQWEAKTWIAQASPKAAAHSWHQPGWVFASNSFYFFPDKISLNHEMQLSRWVSLVWREGGGVSSMWKRTGRVWDRAGVASAGVAAGMGTPAGVWILCQ